MGRTLRTVATASTVLALAVMGPAAMAQDFPFCAILSAEEVSAAVGAESVPTSGTDDSCMYKLREADEGDMTTLWVTNGGTTMDVAKAIFPGGEVTTVAGQPAYLGVSAWNNVLYIDRGDGDTLSLAFYVEPGPVDAVAALRVLGELAFPRLATLAIPNPTPVGVAQGDPELAALFPKEIAGAPVTALTMVGGLTMTPEQQAQVEQLLAAQGKTLADVSLGAAYDMDPMWSISAIRVRGSDARALVGPFVAMSSVEGVPAPAQVAGKDVIVATVSGQVQHVYAKDDVIWLVSATEPILTEVFQKLP